jgi:hypothetical protein
MTISPSSNQIAPRIVWIRTYALARDFEPTMQVVELDVKLQMLLDDVLDRDRGSYLYPFAVGVFREQGLGVAFNDLVGDVRHLKRHVVRLICIDKRS